MPGGSILVIRFSALGDVAMTVPVIRLALQQHPQLRFVVVSRAAFGALFAGMDRVAFVAADLKGRHKGMRGLYRLYCDIAKNYKIKAVADLHAVTRSFILGAFFRLAQVPVMIIDKGRKAKKKLTRKDAKELVQLPSSPERYARVLAYLGYKINFTSNKVAEVADNATLPLAASGAQIENDAPESLNSSNKGVSNSPVDASIIDGQKIGPSPVILDKAYKNIGIAPFAQHQPKMYPLEQFEKLLAQLYHHPHYKLWLFGGGEKEIQQLTAWQKTYPAIEVVAGKYTMSEELGLMRGLDLMISMDSANMHLASMVQIPVVSIWGATHPYAGFYGWQQDPDNAVQIDLSCRPCSVYGNKPCYRGDHACMVAISPAMILAKVEQVLGTNNKSKK